MAIADRQYLTTGNTGRAAVLDIGYFRFAIDYLLFGYIQRAIAVSSRFYKS
jgi:hypothetical protein